MQIHGKKKRKKKAPKRARLQKSLTNKTAILSLRRLTKATMEKYGVKPSQKPDLLAQVLEKQAAYAKGTNKGSLRPKG